MPTIADEIDTIIGDTMSKKYSFIMMQILDDDDISFQNKQQLITCCCLYFFKTEGINSEKGIKKQFKQLEKAVLETIGNV